MLKLNLKTAAAAAVLAGSLAGVTLNPADSLAASGSTHATGSIFQTGDTQGEIRVISGDNQSWTQIKPGFGFVTFPVQLAANALPGGRALSHVWVVQGNSLDVTQVLYDSGDISGDMQHTHSEDLTGGALKLTPEEKDEIVASCNANLDPSTQQQPEHEEEAQVPLTLVMQTVNPGGGAISEGLDWHEDTATTHFPVKVVCEPFTRTMAGPSDKLAVDPDSANIVQVELGLSANGNAVVGGPLEYTGSCPMGLTLNMRWVTNIGTGLESYIKHKDLAGAHNWTSEEFSVTTNQPAYGGNWKKEMTDLISIPFAGSTPSTGPGGANANNQPGGGVMFKPGGSGGLDPATSVGATNTGTNNGLTQYIGYFKLVAYKNKQVVTLPALGGGTQDVTTYDAYKSSDWRKYIVTCEPKQSTVALDAPKGLVDPPKTGVFNPDDAPPFPRPKPKVDTAFDPATQDLTGPTVHKPRPPRDIVHKHSAGLVKNDDVPERIKKLAAEARRKQAAGNTQSIPKRVPDAALKAREAKLKADAANKRRQALIAAQEAAERKRILDAANKARMLKLRQDRAKAAAQAAAQARANALRALTAKRANKVKAAPRRRTTTAPAVNRMKIMRVR